MKIAYRDIAVIKTQEGTMTPIYRDWDSIVPGYKPAMSYVTTIGPTLEKGPILHKKRSGYLTSISGKVEIEYYEDSCIKKVFLFSESEDFLRVIFIPPGVPIKIINTSSIETATILNLPDIAWHPDNQDTIKFSNWSECIAYVKD